MMTVVVALGAHTDLESRPKGMRFNKHKGQAIDPELIPAYVDFVAEHENAHVGTLELGGPTSLRHASQLIAYACKALAEEDAPGEPIANGFLAKARATIDAKVERTAWVEPDSSNFQASMLQLGIGILAARNSAADAQRAREYGHLTITTQLARVQGKLDKIADQYGERDSIRTCDAYRIYIGRANELATLGLVTRLVHPEVLAMPALTHHDQHASVGHNNFDFTITTMDEGRPTTNMIQTKHTCLGFCGNAKKEYGDSVRSKYSPDITLVSGHCDLSAELTADGVISMPAARLLIREVGNIANRHETASLDELSAHIINCPGQPNRHGTYRSTV